MYLLPVCHFKSEDLEKYVGGRVTQTGTVTISIISVYYFALIGLNGSLKSASERSCTETLNGWELHSLWYESELAKHSHRICLSYIMLSKVRKRKHVGMCSTFSDFKLSCDRQMILVHECHIRAICKCVLRLLRFDWLIELNDFRLDFATAGTRELIDQFDQPTGTSLGKNGNNGARDPQFQVCAEEADCDVQETLARNASATATRLL